LDDYGRLIRSIHLWRYVASDELLPPGSAATQQGREP